MIAQVGLSPDLSHLVQPFLIFGITFICLILCLFACAATQIGKPNIPFALMGGTFSAATGLICLVWGVRIFHRWSGLLYIPALALLFGLLTVAAGVYMHRVVVKESRKED